MFHCSTANDSTKVKERTQWIGKGCCFVSCTTRWMRSHTTSHLEIIRKGFSMGISWLGGRGLHTTRSIVQRVAFNVTSGFNDADLLACKLGFPWVQFMMPRVLRCPSRQGISSLCCSACAFSAFWIGRRKLCRQLKPPPSLIKEKKAAHA